MSQGQKNSSTNCRRVSRYSSSSFLAEGPAATGFQSGREQTRLVQGTFGRIHSISCARWKPLLPASKPMRIFLFPAPPNPRIIENNEVQENDCYLPGGGTRVGGTVWDDVAESQVADGVLATAFGFAVTCNSSWVA